MHGRKFAYNISLPWVERYVDGISFLPAFEREVPLLSDDFREQVSGYDDPRDLMFRYFKEAPAQDAVSKTLYVDTKTYLTADILTKVDRMSMAASLELRAPILDHIFVEWATALPVEWKLRGNFQKFILVKLAEKLGVPREVLYRRKQGFSLPLVHWMRHELKEMIQATLLGDRALQRAYFRPEGVRQLVEEHFTGRRDQSARIWRLMMLELWHRNFLERVSAPDFAHSLSYSTPVLKATG
jgi:asparagine synthase (glutamine-hydrolysing)